jgi:hypothetical protein
MAVTVGKFVNNYASSKLCCVATNVVEADKDFKYGAKDAMCCIANNFVATTYLEMLQCNDYTSWAHIEEKNMVLNASAGAVGVKYMRFVKDDDPTQYVELVTPGFTFTATGSGTADMDAVIAEINSYEDPLWDNIIVTAQRDTVSNKFRFIVEADINFWNGYKLQISATAGFGLSSASPAEFANAYYMTEPANSKYSCFTDQNLCDLKDWLDNYCDSCTKSYAAKAVTTTL